MFARWQRGVVGADVVVDAFAGDAAHSRGGRWSWTSLSMWLWGDVACSRGGRGSGSYHLYHINLDQSRTCSSLYP